jgi:hypothetical protein
MGATIVKRALLFAGLLASLPASAATWCVTTAAQFRTRLATAASNGEDDTINLARGIYLEANDEFMFNSNETFALDITGGYNADCSTLIRNPKLTILDGGGTIEVLNTNSKGAVSLRYLTIQNGRQSGSSGGGLSMAGTGAGSQVILYNNILRNNVSDYAVGAAIISVDGLIRVINNLITGNSAPGVGALYLDPGADSAVYLNNNTIAENTVTGTLNSTMVFINYTNPTVPNAYASNNVFWSNTGGSDMRFYDQRLQLNFNEYQNIVGIPFAASANNVTLNPGFAGPGNFNLLPSSLLLNLGLATPIGGLSPYDIEGHPRTYNGLIDFGAYERGDIIFGDGLDN